MRSLPRRLHPYLWICAILVAVELAVQGFGLAAGNSGRLRSLAVGFFGFWPGLLGDWQSNFRLQPLTMFATYWLVHAGPAHLFGNLAIIGWFGLRVGPRLERTKSWEIWAVSVLGGGVAFGLLGPGYSPMIGASGGLFGLLGAFVVLDYREAHGLDGAARAARRTALICAAIAGLSVLDYILRDAVLAWQAHLGGFIAGAALAAALPTTSD